MSCADCNQTRQGIDTRLQNEIDAAKKDAIDHQEPMAIYEDGGEYRHINAFRAKELGLLVVRNVSQYQ